jgi:hypothetical protein
VRHATAADRRKLPKTANSLPAHGLGIKLMNGEAFYGRSWWASCSSIAVCVVKTVIQSIIVGFCKMSKKDAIKHELSKYNDLV